MKKIEALEKKIRDSEAAKAALLAEMDGLKARQTAYSAEAQAAAEAGDTDAYMKKKAASDRTDAEIYVKEQQIKKAALQIGEDEVGAAWREYSAAYGKEYEKRWAAYCEARRKLGMMFMEIVDGQREALAVQARCGALLGRSEDMERLLPLRYIPAANPAGLHYKMFTSITADEAFFYASGEIPETSAEYIHGVLRQHKPVNR